MKSAEKMKSAMRPGRVYRRKDLEEFSTAASRDLQTLVKSGEVRKLRYGLYCRPKKNAPPDRQELIRAFLKTDDFLLIAATVYNHKRSGEFNLGNKRFKFRLVPAYPKTASKEYLFVDRLNNLPQSPDAINRVLGNLSSRLSQFDEDKLRESLERYGRPTVIAVFKRARRARRARTPLAIADKEDARADLRYWLAQSPAERVGAVEFLRAQYYALSGSHSIPRMNRAA